MKKVSVALVITLLLTSVATFAQPPTAGTPKEFSDSYDAFIRRVMERLPDTPGIVVVVLKDDKPIFLRGYGFADKEAGKKADADALFYIGSSTKSFTALTAALLDKEGKLKLADSVTKYADSVRFKEPLPDKITVRDLLTHTSGLKNGPLIFRTAFSGQIEPQEIKTVFADSTTFTDARLHQSRLQHLRAAAAIPLEPQVAGRIAAAHFCPARHETHDSLSHQSSGAKVDSRRAVLF
jgi:CubicO group peptidase (beta-lactamase class C family)